MKWTHIILHHTAAEESGIDQIRKYHVNVLGWRDIGYHFVVEKDGTVATGRSLSLPGAHARGWNYNAIGVACIGNMSNRELYRVQFNALVGHLCHLCKKFDIPVSNILLHKNVSNTACPGKLFPDLQEIRKDVIIGLLKRGNEDEQVKE
jgi:N-acetylmuramoyl-L-alanine amidase